MTVTPTTFLGPSSSALPAIQWRPSSTAKARSRVKRYHAKARTGCLTCRRRRVKCDEGLPSCLRCLKREEECRYEVVTIEPRPTRYRPSFLPSSELDLSHLNFFIVNTTDMLSLLPDSPLSKTSPLVFDDYHGKYARFWKGLVLPLVFAEPLILELVSLLARRHRLALTTSRSGTADYIRMVSVMSKIVETRPVNIVIVGAMIIFAYECLHVASSRDELDSKIHIHSDAFMRLLPISTDMIADYVMPMVGVTWTMIRFCMNNGDRSGPLAVIPDHFETGAMAQASFSDILEGSNMQPAIEKWLKVTSDLYERMRGKHWEESKLVLTLLTEGQLFLTVIRLSQQPGRAERMGQPLKV